MGSRGTCQIWHDRVQMLGLPLKPVIWLGDSLRELHAFQKKSRSGIATPKADIELIRQRLKQAVEISKKQEE